MQVTVAPPKTLIEHKPRGLKISAAICKHCGTAEKVVGFGRKDGVERYLCNKCKHTFLDNHKLPYMQYGLDVIQTALSEFNESISLSKLEKKIEKKHLQSPCQQTLWRWIKRFSETKTVANTHTVMDLPLQQSLSSNKSLFSIEKVSTIFIAHRNNAWFWYTRKPKQKPLPILPSFYPFISEENPTDTGYDLVIEVNKLVPKTIPEDMRKDICQDILLAILSNKLRLEDVTMQFQSFVKSYYKNYSSPHILSLERATMGDSDDLYLGDTMTEDNLPWNKLLGKPIYEESKELSLLGE